MIWIKRLQEQKAVVRRGAQIRSSETASAVLRPDHGIVSPPHRHSAMAQK